MASKRSTQTTEINRRAGPAPMLMTSGSISTLNRITSYNVCYTKLLRHPNEPVHHVPFLFNRIGSPWLTQKWSREICTRAYKNGVDGLVGNEDVGQMSAWYVLAASGLYQVCPGSYNFV